MMTAIAHSHEVSIKISQDIFLKGILSIPKEATKIIVFAHGSGSGRYSPRNQYVANLLLENGLGILLLDLLTPSEEAIDEETRHLRFDILLLASRLLGTADWLTQQKETKGLKIGYFGSSTGAAAALVVAAESQSTTFALVSRGGRPDLAASVLHRIKAPTLLIVGGDDYGVIELNQEALDMLPGEKKIEIIPHATHLFEERGKLEEVAKLAASWFTSH